jgi:acyl-coenzyme A thioesterase 13
VNDSKNASPGDEQAIPPGFSPSQRSSPFLDLIGPVFVADRDDGVVVGMRVQSHHLNNRGAVHGAVASALADITMGRNVAARTSPPTSVVTVTLTVDFIAGAALGQWLEATASVQRVGRRLAFAQGRITADGKLIAQTSATFAVPAQP